jgi:m7GpppX diphosphatase
MTHCVHRDDRQKQAVFVDEQERSLVILERLPISDCDLDRAKNDFTPDTVNDVYKWGTIDSHTKVTIIEPFDESHRSKYTTGGSDGKRTVVETAQDYCNITLPWIRDQKRTDWVDNIIEGRAESEAVLYSDCDFVILPNYKWCTGNLDELSLLCIFKNRQYRCLRDVDSAEILLKAKDRIRDTLLAKYDLAIDAVSLYFHYPPTYYRLHIHVTSNKSVEFVSSHVPLAHHLDTVVYNLSVMPRYYTHASLPMLIGRDHPLCNHHFSRQ